MRGYRAASPADYFARRRRAGRRLTHSYNFVRIGKASAQAMANRQSAGTDDFLRRKLTPQAEHDSASVDTTCLHA